MKLINSCAYKNIFNTLNKFILNNYIKSNSRLKNKNFVVITFNQNNILDPHKECHSKKVLKNMIF